LGWGDPAYSLTGDGNVGGVRSGTVTLQDGAQRTLQVGDAVAGFARGALERATAGEHPDIAYSWYVGFLEFVRDTFHPLLGPVVAVGEVVIGVALILGLFAGIMAFLATPYGPHQPPSKAQQQRSPEIHSYSQSAGDSFW
jgi:hypothetical protein